VTGRQPRATQAPMLSVREAAIRFGFRPGDTRLVYEWIKSGLLPAVRYPGRTGKPGTYRIAETDVDAFIAAHRQAAS
jgi:excisionase family DNA binding protein